MAKDDTELDTTAPSGSGKKKLILIIVLVVALVGVSVGATLFLTGALGGGKAHPGKKAETAQIKPTLYLPLDPTFVVNFENQSMARYLQVKLQIMARSKAALNAVQSQMPVIRNNILLLLSSQRYAQVSTSAGKDKLRQAILDSINKVLHDAGSKEHITAVYFTGFVMQ